MECSQLIPPGVIHSVFPSATASLGVQPKFVDTRSRTPLRDRSGHHVQPLDNEPLSAIHRRDLYLRISGRRVSVDSIRKRRLRMAAKWQPVKYSHRRPMAGYCPTPTRWAPIDSCRPIPAGRERPLPSIRKRQVQPCGPSGAVEILRDVPCSRRVRSDVCELADFCNER
jgi:hypothetical protein